GTSLGGSARDPSRTWTTSVRRPGNPRGPARAASRAPASRSPSGSPRPSEPVGYHTSSTCPSPVTVASPVPQAGESVYAIELDGSVAGRDRAVDPVRAVDLAPTVGPAGTVVRATLVVSAGAVDPVGARRPRPADGRAGRHRVRVRQRAADRRRGGGRAAPRPPPPRGPAPEHRHGPHRARPAAAGDPRRSPGPRAGGRQPAGPGGRGRHPRLRDVGHEVRGGRRPAPGGDVPTAPLRRHVPVLRGGGGDLRPQRPAPGRRGARSEEHTSELQSRENLVCRLLLEKTT